MRQLNTKVISCFSLMVLTFGCAGTRQTVTGPKGNTIPLPECKEYISRYSNLGIKWEILKKYEGQISLSMGTETSLQDLQQHYVLQARELCEKAGVYFASGESQQYFCRDERLSNSAIQLETINRFLEGISNIEDAKEKSLKIEQLINDYHDRFYKQLDKPCSSAPEPISYKDIEGLYEKMNKVLLAIIDLTKKNLDLIEPGKSLSGDEKRREFDQLKSEFDLLKRNYVNLEEKISQLENRAPKEINVNLVPPSAPTGFIVK